MSKHNTVLPIILLLHFSSDTDNLNDILSSRIGELSYTLEVILSKLFHIGLLSQVIELIYYLQIINIKIISKCASSIVHCLPQPTKR